VVVLLLLLSRQQLHGPGPGKKLGKMARPCLPVRDLAVIFSAQGKVKGDVAAVGHHRQAEGTGRLRLFGPLRDEETMTPPPRIPKPGNQGLSLNDDRSVVNAREKKRQPRKTKKIDKGKNDAAAADDDDDEEDEKEEEEEESKLHPVGASHRHRPWPATYNFPDDAEHVKKEEDEGPSVTREGASRPRSRRPSSERSSRRRGSSGLDEDVEMDDDDDEEEEKEEEGADGGGGGDSNRGKRAKLKRRRRRKNSRNGDEEGSVLSRRSSRTGSGKEVTVDSPRQPLPPPVSTVPITPAVLGLGLRQRRSSGGTTTAESNSDGTTGPVGGPAGSSASKPKETEVNANPRPPLPKPSLNVAIEPLEGV